MWWQDTSRLRLYSRSYLVVFLSGAALLLVSLSVSWTQEATPSVRTQLEVQSELISYADRFYMFLAQAAKAPEFRANADLFGDQVLIVWSAVTIAAAPNPEVGLLDMIILTTLGRMIYEEEYRPRFGTLVQPVIAAFRLLEADIWRVAGKYLPAAEQQELRTLIRIWRRKHPKQVAFAMIRFSDFAEERQEFTLDETTKARGLFKSVQQATQKVDAALLLAERGAYLGTRLPLIMGAVGEVWVSRWMQRPELAQVSDAVERAVQQVEQLPEHANQIRRATITQLMDRLAVERKAAINHFMDRVSTERQQVMQDLTSDETDSQGLLAETHQVLTASSELATAVQGAVQAFDHFSTQADARLVAVGKKPADMTDIRGLVGEVSQAANHIQGLVEALNQLLLSPGWEQRLPQLLHVLERAETEGREFVGFSARQAFFYGIMLTLVVLVGCILAVLAYQYVLRRFFGVRM